MQNICCFQVSVSSEADRVNFTLLGLHENKCVRNYVLSGLYQILQMTPELKTIIEKSRVTASIEIFNSVSQEILGEGGTWTIS